MKKRFTDRKDGKRYIPKDPVHKIMPYIIERRHEAEVYLQSDLDVTELLKWIDKQNKKNDHHMTFFHAFAAITAKTICTRPLLNRFVQGKRYYDRNDITLSFVAKDKFTDEAEEKLMIIKVKDNENAIDLSKRMGTSIKKTKESGNSIDHTIRLLCKMPRFLLSAFVHFVKWLDYHGKAPSFITEGDYNFATVLFSNLGSIKCDSIYHHLNDYGTNSLIITIGTIHKENVIDESGKKQTKDIVSIGIVADERIADGFYFAKSIRLMKYIAQNPQLLEEDINKVVVDYE